MPRVIYCRWQQSDPQMLLRDRHGTPKKKAKKLANIQSTCAIQHCQPPVAGPQMNPIVVCHAGEAGPTKDAYQLDVPTTR
jgi:hypothetical protein